MEIHPRTRTLSQFYAVACWIVLLLWLVCTILLYWHSPYQETVSLYEGRWLLSSLAVTSFFVFLFTASASSTTYTAAHVSTQYSLVYSVASLFIQMVNSIQILFNWPSKESQGTKMYLQLTFILLFLSFLGALLSYNFLNVLVNMIRDLDRNFEQLVCKSNLMICSQIHIILGILNFFICYEMIDIAAFASSFIVQEVCCTFLSISIAYMQWKFRYLCNINILRAVVLMNVCQFIQELTFAYNTYLLVMLINPSDASAIMNTDRYNKIQRLLIGAFLIHGSRLILCGYSVIVCVKKAFPAETASRIIFLPDQERRITAVEAAQEGNADEKGSKRLFKGASVLVFLCAVTDMIYALFGSVRRVGSTGVSLIYTICLLIAFYYYRRDKRTVFLKVTAVLSISMFSSSVHTIYAFGKAMFDGRLYEALEASFADAVTHGLNFFLTAALIVLSVNSALFSFQTITKHTALIAQPASITRWLRVLANLAYIFIAVVAIEILFTVAMVNIFEIQVSLVLNTEVFLWFSSLSTFSLQIWVCKHDRFQRCMIILIIQLIVDCSTTLPLITVEAGIVQKVIAVMSRHGKSFRDPSARIIYVSVDHVLQILQWLLTNCSLGMALIVLNIMETEEDEYVVFNEGIAFFNAQENSAASVIDNQIVVVRDPLASEEEDGPCEINIGDGINVGANISACGGNNESNGGMLLEDVSISNSPNDCGENEDKDDNDGNEDVNQDRLDDIHQNDLVDYDHPDGAVDVDQADDVVNLDQTDDVVGNDHESNATNYDDRSRKQNHHGQDDMVHNNYRDDDILDSGGQDDTVDSVDQDDAVGNARQNGVGENKHWDDTHQVSKTNNTPVHVANVAIGEDFKHDANEVSDANCDVNVDSDTDSNDSKKL